MRYLWVVEILINGKWESTRDVEFSRSSGRANLQTLKEAHHREKFRLVKYVPEAK